MLPRRPKKTPRNMSEFKKRFGWSAMAASSLLVGRGRNLSEESAATALKILAGDYYKWFVKKPNKTHLFPLTGSIFQYEFARGVRDAANLKTRLRTIAPIKGEKHFALPTQVSKLGLSKGIVVHDFFASGDTVKAISKSCGFRPWTVQVHNLTRGQDASVTGVPIFGEQRLIDKLDICGKRVDPKTLKIDLSPQRKHLSQKKIAFVKRAVYAVGFASTRELLAKKEK